MNIRRWVRGAGAGSLLMVLTVCAAPQVALAYNDAYIRDNLKDGIQTAFAADQRCKDYLMNEPSAAFGAGGTGRFRQLLMGELSNSSGVPYGPTGDSWGAWVSLLNQPAQTTPSVVPYGATSIDLQINGYHFFCAPHTVNGPNPNADSLTPLNSTSTARQAYDDRNGTGSWITSDDVTNGVAKNRYVQPLGTNYYDTVKSFEILQVRSVALLCDSAGASADPMSCGDPVGSINLSDANKTLSMKLSDEFYAINDPTDSRRSRYAFPGDPGQNARPDVARLQYVTSTAPVDGKRTLVIRLTFREMGLFNARYEGSVPATTNAATKQCLTNDGGNVAVRRVNTADPGTAVDGNGNSCIDIQVDLYLTLIPDAVYDLTPQVSLSSQVVSPGESLAITPQVIAAPSGTPSPSTTGWSVTRMIVDPGDSITPTGITTNTSEPCDTYSGYQRCDGNFAGGSQAFPAGSTTTLTADALDADEVSSYPTGTKICYALKVDPSTSGSDNKRHSVPACAIVAKSPTVSISGGDAKVGFNNQVSNIVTSGRTIGGMNYGGWGEYGLFATGDIHSSSAGVLARQGGRAGASSDKSSLMFANTTVGGAAKSPAGGFTDDFGARDTYDGMVNRFSTGSSLNNWDSGRYTGNRTINTTRQVPGGRSVIVDASGTVTINQNIIYSDGPYTNPSDIPQVIIRAQNIVINPRVTRVDAWLIATGTISTCGPVRTSGNYFDGLDAGSSCNDNQLRINGPVSAAHLQLRRTAGAEGTTDAERARNAEALNLRPDSYLWAYGQATSSGVARTTYVQELPPRF